MDAMRDIRWHAFELGVNQKGKKGKPAFAYHHEMSNIIYYNINSEAKTFDCKDGLFR